MTHVASALLAAHLICMMLASSGPILAALLEMIAGRRGNLEAYDCGRRVASMSLSALTLGGLLGFLVGLILAMGGQRDYSSAFVPLERRVYWGIGEFAFSFVLTFLYAICWDWNRHRTLTFRFLHRALALLTTTNLLYHFPLLMFVLASFAAGRAPLPPTLDAAEFREIAWHAVPILSMLHFAGAAFTIGGTWVAMFGARPPISKSASIQADAPVAMVLGGRVALAATCLQFPLGLALLARLDATRQHQFFGENMVATGCLATAILAAVGLLHELAAMAFGNHRPHSATIALSLNVVVLVLMVVAKQAIH